VTKFSKHHTRAAKMTAEMVFKMRQRYAEGASQSELADEFDLSIVQVGRIVRGEAWRSVANPAKMLSEEELAAVGRRLLETQREVNASKGQPPIEQSDSVLERLQRDVAAERKPADELDKFLNPDKVRSYLGNKDDK
jgi:transcriptional regulator with XRE-family HTH domain